MKKSLKTVEDIIIQYNKCKDIKKKHLLYLDVIDYAVPLVKKIAYNISLQTGISIEDLIQVGFIGLIKSISSYKPNFNAAFNTYATYIIKGEIRHYVRDKANIVKPPRDVQELIFKISSTVSKLTQEMEGVPSVEAVAKELSLPVEKVEEVMNFDKYRISVSLDQFLTGDDEEISLLDKIPAEESQDILNSCETKILISETLKHLPPDYKQLIELAYYKDLPRKDIAQMLDMTPMQLSRKLKKVLTEMYNIINEKGVNL